MKLRLLVIRVLAPLLSLALTCDIRALSQTRKQALPFRITALSAKLFFGETGTFSADLFGPNAPPLRNVRTGEGQSSATLVLVGVTGEPGAYVPTRQVTLVATSSGKQLMSRSLPVGRMGDDGKFYAGFWLYDTGCLPITLTARIGGQQPTTPSLSKTLDFKCGD